MELDSVKAVYQKWASFYDISFGAITTGARRHIAAAANNAPSGRILEIGVGTGLNLPLYNGGHKITGIDICPNMISRARTRAKKSGLNGSIEALLDMNAESLEFEDDYFDIVVISYVLSVAPNPEKILDEIQRVCKKDGKIVIANHFDKGKGFLHFIDRLLSPLANYIGWEPEFPIDICLQREGIKILENRQIPPFGLFTLLVCSNNKA